MSLPLLLSVFASGEVYAGQEVVMAEETDLIAEFQGVEDRFNRAMVSNDVGLIAACITDDWVLVNPQSGPVPRDMILSIIGAGILTHSMMTKKVHRVKAYETTAVVTSRGQNTGTYQGAPIEADEWITDVYVRRGGDWLCSLTHLTPVTPGT